jgi:hypothetical protein
MIENQFIAAARGIPIPSLAVLDSWLNYSNRLSGSGGRLDYLPDRIAIMDKRAQVEMVAEGFDPARLVVTGQPAFDNIVRSREQFTSAHRQALRGQWGVGESERVVLFASQPLSVLYGTDPANPAYMGFYEHTVLPRLVAALEAIATDSGRAVALVVRPHPREDRGWLEGLRSAAVRIVVSSEGDPREAALSADLVTGMNSVLLMEACYMRCLAVSLQPGLRRTDVLPTNRWGFSRAVYREEDIKPVIEQMLLDQETRLAAQARLVSLQPPNGATQRVVNLVYEMIGLAVL